MLRLSVLAALFYTALAVTSLADIITKEEFSTKVIGLVTDIDYGDADKVEATIREAIAKDLMVRIVLDDNIGGSVTDAIRIGRMARALDVFVQVYGKCYSSCALIYLGGSSRSPIAAEIGLHRPYFDVTATGKRPTQKDIEQMFEEVRSYLIDVKASTSVFDAMMNVPPESMKIYGTMEDIEATFGSRDPVYSELANIEMSQMYGLSMSEYLTIKATDFLPMCESLSSDILEIGKCVLSSQSAALWQIPLSRAEYVSQFEQQARLACKRSYNQQLEFWALSRELKLKSLESLDSTYVRSIIQSPLYTQVRDCVVREMEQYRN